MPCCILWNHFGINKNRLALFWLIIEIKESTYLFSLAFSERTTTESIIDLFLMPYVTILDIFQRLTNVLILLIAIVDVGVFYNCTYSSRLTEDFLKQFFRWLENKDHTVLKQF